MNIPLLILCFVIVAVLYATYRSSLKNKRRRLIESYAFPESIPARVLEKYPHLTSRQVSRVMDGLREYFHVCNHTGRRMVAMPSQVVDVAWHEFILFTREYDYFCSRAIGRFLHHTPAEAMKSATLAQEGIKRAWRVSCLRENIKPDKPKRLPLLFALDAELAIPDGFSYQLDCKKAGNSGYCAGHIGCGSGDSGCGGD